MGGAIEKEDLHTFGWLLHISLLKVELQCNVLPIGLISKGFYCHRALLFKVKRPPRPPPPHSSMVLLLVTVDTCPAGYAVLG